MGLDLFFVVILFCLSDLGSYSIADASECITVCDRVLGKLALESILFGYKRFDVS